MATLNIKSFPEELYHSLGERAKIDRRSVSAEVIYLLEWALSVTEKKKHSILELQGLGKKHWKNRDAVRHVSNERDAWE